MIYLVLAVFCLIGLPVGTLVARDLDHRGGDGRLAGALTFLFLPLGLVVWLVQRSQLRPTSKEG